MKKKEPEIGIVIDPTKAELEILQAIWEMGPSTVRQVNTFINKRRFVNYSSTLKLMQIMYEKKLLKRDESNMKHIYDSAIEEYETKSLLIDRFIGNLFGGSASSLILQILGNEKASQNDLNKIKNILDKMKK